MQLQLHYCSSGLAAPAARLPPFLLFQKEVSLCFVFTAAIHLKQEV
jgi:hypothetical protein